MKTFQNKFFDLILFFLSIIFSFFRSILLILGLKKDVTKGSFFKFLDYFFRFWPNNFWKKPTGFKIGMFLGGLIKYVFYNKK